jgi:hypothetical protein
MSTKKKQAYIEQLNYRASESHPLDLEIFSVSDLRQRVSSGFLRSTHRYRFHMLVCVTRGECMHMIDFKLIACKPGSLLAASPAQAHRFGLEKEWDGWIVLFRQEFLLSSQATASPATAPVTGLRLTAGLEGMPEHLTQLRLACSGLGTVSVWWKEEGSVFRYQSMIVIGTDVVERHFAAHGGHRGIKAARAQYDAWRAVAASAHWKTPQDIKKAHPKHGMSRADLVPLLGTPSRVSEVLTGKRELSMSMVRKLRERFHISADLLISPVRRRGLAA